MQLFCLEVCSGFDKPTPDAHANKFTGEPRTGGARGEDWRGGGKLVVISFRDANAREQHEMRTDSLGSPTRKDGKFSEIYSRESQQNSMKFFETFRDAFRGPRNA